MHIMYCELIHLEKIFDYVEHFYQYEPRKMLIFKEPTKITIIINCLLKYNNQFIFNEVEFGR